MDFQMKTLSRIMIVAVALGLWLPAEMSAQIPSDALRLGTPGIGVGARALGLGDAYIGVHASHPHHIGKCGRAQRIVFTLYRHHYRYAYRWIGSDPDGHLHGGHDTHHFRHANQPDVLLLRGRFYAGGAESARHTVGWSRQFHGYSHQHGQLALGNTHLGDGHLHPKRVGKSRQPYSRHI